MSWWNPISWVEDASNDVAKTVDALKNWAINHIRDAANAVERDVVDAADSLWSEVTSIYNTIAHDVDGVWNGLATDINAVYRDAVSWVDAAEHYADVGIDFAWRDVIKPQIDFLTWALSTDLHLAESAVDDVRGALVDFEHTASEWVDDVRGALVDFERTAQGWVDDGIRTVEKYADDGITMFDRDVVKPVEDLLSTVQHDASVALDFALHEGADAVHLVEKAWDWLVILADNTVADIEAIPSEVERAFDPSTWIDTLRSVAVEAATGVGDFASKAFAA